MSTTTLLAFRMMTTKPLSPRELRIWHAFLSMGEDVLERVGRDIARVTELSGSEFGVLSRLAAFGHGEMRQQELATVMGWEKSRLSHQLSRMQKRRLVERRAGEGRAVLIVLTRTGREKLGAALPIRAESVRRQPAFPALSRADRDDHSREQSTGR